MGKVSELLIEMIRKQVIDRGVVVWYDPQKVYSGLVHSLALPEVTVLQYTDGFFRLRKKLEPYLECVSDDGQMKPEADRPPSMIVYVPMSREDSNYALIEAETAGAVMEPSSAQSECNTRLGLIVEKIFGEIAPAKATHLARQADEGLLTLEELDRMAGDAGASATGVLQIIFGHASAEEIILQFLASDVRDEAIAEKNAITDLATFLREETGFESSEVKNAANLRGAFRRYVLIADLLLKIPAQDIPDDLRLLTLPDKPVQQDLVRHVCTVWRNRLDLKDQYVEAAESVEKATNLQTVSLPLDSLETADTFSLLERRWLAYAGKALAGGDVTEALRIFNVRTSRFWARERAEFQMAWMVIEAAARIRVESERVLDELKKRKWSLEEMVNAYAAHAEPWMKVDRWARHLDSRYARLDAMDSGVEGHEKGVILARQRYADAVNAICSAYAKAASTGEFAAGRFIRQTETYKSAVCPVLDKKVKTAYILFDALRYEMAAELLEGLSEDYVAVIEPVLGQLPGITQVGMAALMPEAEKGLSIETKKAAFAISISGTMLGTRQDRMSWIQEKAGVSTVVYRLGEAVKLTPKKKKEIAAADLVIVTAQEIDKLGEEGADEDEYRIYMDEVLEKARRAIRTLARAGVSEFIIAADHGFHLVAAMDPGLSMDQPGGDTIELHPRVWIGQGGVTGEGFLRLKASDLELGGSLEFAFPLGIGTFKVKGGIGAYFHGGISPQEHILPLIRVTVRESGVVSRGGTRVKLSISKTKITNRIFTVTIEAKGEELFPGAAKRVRLEAVSGKTVVGQAVVAGYGFDESTREVTVAPGTPNVVTLMLSPGETPDAITIQVWDCETQLVLDSIKDIQVELSI